MEEKFEADLRMTITEYRAVTLAAIAKYALIKSEDITVRNGLIDFDASLPKFSLAKAWFGNTVSAEKLDSFLAKASATAADFLEPCTKAEFIYDFTPFRERPLLRAGNEYYAVDTGFLADKLETGPFWQVQVGLQKKDRLRSLAFWARIFEGYVWLLKECVDATKNVFYANPLFRSRKNEEREICDAFIQCGNFLAIVECKGGFFERDSKYSGDAAKLRQSIQEKLVLTNEGDKKGIEQLASSINSLFAHESNEVARDVDLSSVKWIYPVLVVREAIVDAPGVNRLLNREFNKVIDRRRLRVKVESLFCLSATTLEGIAPYLSSLRFTDILDARKAGDKNLLMPFAMAPNDVIDNAPAPGDGCISRKFGQIMNEVERQLFPVEAAEHARRERSRP